MSEVGTLKELDVKPGDVVECVRGKVYADTGYKYTVNAEYEVNGRKIENIDSSQFRIISRATQTPKLWRDMTDAEKGALLLAHHEGKVIEVWRRGSGGWATFPECFHENEAYRVRPEPKVEVVDVFWKRGETGYNHKIGTMNLIDGKPDCASIKMEEL